MPKIVTLKKIWPDINSLKTTIKSSWCWIKPSYSWGNTLRKANRTLGWEMGLEVRRCGLYWIMKTTWICFTQDRWPTTCKKEHAKRSTIMNFGFIFWQVYNMILEGLEIQQSTEKWSSNGDTLRLWVKKREPVKTSVQQNLIRKVK